MPESNYEIGETGGHRATPKLTHIGSPTLAYLAPQRLSANPRNTRTHSKKQVKQIAESIRAFGFNNPILVDDAGEVIAGHGRLAAAIQMDLKEVPVVRLSHLSEAQKRAYVLADNKIALNAGWDTELLAGELGDLADLLPSIELDLTITGFETGEIDMVLGDFDDLEEATDANDSLPPVQQTAVACFGDVWSMGPHRLLCGDARSAAAIGHLFDGQIASLVVTDPPYNVKMQGHASGRGKIKHSEFAFASGEMSDDEFAGFLSDSLSGMIECIRPGAMLYVFMDWRHIELLLAAGRNLDLDLKNICVWNKTPPGEGSYYRSAHELVAVFANRGGPTSNNIQLGKFGCNRSNIWTYPSMNTFQTDAGDDFALHPTVKPLAMIAEAIKDASKRGSIVFDPFLGSGTTLLAAEKVGRRCFGVEYEPKYVDVAIRRWQAATGKDAVWAGRCEEGDFVPAETPITFEERQTAGRGVSYD